MVHTPGAAAGLWCGGAGLTGGGGCGGGSPCERAKVKNMKIRDSIIIWQVVVCVKIKVGIPYFLIAFFLSILLLILHSPPLSRIIILSFVIINYTKNFSRIPFSLSLTTLT